MNDYFRAVCNIKPGRVIHHNINGECIEYQILEKAAMKATEYDKVKNKLGGCFGPELNVILVALAKGIRLTNGELYDCSLVYDDNEKIYPYWLVVYEKGEAITAVAIKDYQKTWWLEGDENE